MIIIMVLASNIDSVYFNIYSLKEDESSLKINEIYFNKFQNFGFNDGIFEHFQISNDAYEIFFGDLYKNNWKLKLQF